MRISMTDTNDKDMASFEVIQNNSSGSFESNEYSFLPEVSNCALQNGGYDHSPEKFDMTNMQSALFSATPDLNVEEVESRLVKLVEENQSLKEALSRNNEMMKEQMSTIPAWREQMIMSRNNLQQNLQKSLEKIASLEKENGDLLRKLKSLEEELKEMSSKCQILETTMSSVQKEKNSLEKSKSILASELKEINSFNEDLQQSLISVFHYLDKLLLRKNNFTDAERDHLESVVVLLKSKVAALEGNFSATVQTDEETGYEVVHQKAHMAEAAEENMQELSKAANEIEELKKQLAEKNKECEAAEEKMQQISKASNEIEDLKKHLAEKNKECEAAEEKMQQLSEALNEIEKLKKQLAEKNTELVILKQHDHEMAEKIQAYAKQQLESEMGMKNKYEVMNNKMSIEKSLAEKYKERCESLQQQLDESHAKLENAKLADDHVAAELQEEARNLRDILKLEQRANQEDKEKHNETMLKCEQLQVDYDRVLQLLEIQRKDEKICREEFAILHQKEEKCLREEIDHLTARLLDIEQNLDDKNEEVTKLTEKLSMVEEESETIPILKGQVEVYKTDLSNALAERDSANQEIERLQKEIKMYQDSGTNSPGHRRVTREQDNPQGGEPAPIECPICGRGFDSVQAAQNHINRCAEKADGFVQPPKATEKRLLFTTKRKY